MKRLSDIECLDFEKLSSPTGTGAPTLPYGIFQCGFQDEAAYNHGLST
jgi:hypothetical protein